MAKQKGNRAALAKPSIPKRDFLKWWCDATTVADFVKLAKKGNEAGERFVITEASAIARAGRLRQSTTKQGRTKTAYPLKWMGSTPREDEAVLLKWFLDYQKD
jgi:hypothetical protein